MRSTPQHGGIASSGAGRYAPSLDGLRGLAALVVLVRHTSNAVSMPLEQRRFLIEGPFAIFFNAQGAVQIFFVLSGYVLAASVSRNRHAVDLVQYLVKRIFRIYPPFICAVLFAWVLSWSAEPIDLRAVDGLTPMMARATHVELNSEQLLASLMFPGPAGGLLDVGWTLTIEMIFSLLLPLMLGLARRVHWLALLAVSLVLLLVGSGAILYSLHFTLGIIAFLERDRLSRTFSRLRAAGRATWVALAIVALCGPAMLGWTTLVLGVLVVGHSPENLGIVGVGSVMLVTAALHVPTLRSFLSHPSVVYLGRISFSVYLFHLTLVNWLAPRVVSVPVDWWDRAGLLACVVVSTLLLSTVGYRWLELPAIRAGNRLCAAIARLAGYESVRSELVDRAPADAT